MSTRRNILSLGLILTTLISFGTSAAVAKDASTKKAAPSLKEAYKGAFRLGTAVNTQIVSGEDALSQALVPLHFNTITAENVMKTEVVNPQPGVYDFSAADAFVDFGERHGMFIVGHTLVWHNQTPAWFFQDEKGQPNTREAQIERMRRHIEVVAGRYAGRVHAWDVVNEVIGGDGKYRPTSWVNGIGGGDELVRLRPDDRRPRGAAESASVHGRRCRRRRHAGRRSRAGRVLPDPRAVQQPGGAVVAFACVDLHTGSESRTCLLLGIRGPSGSLK